jgi:hypothetical protein
VFLLLFAVVVVEGMVSAYGTVFVVVAHHHRVVIIILGGERGHFFLFTRKALFFCDESVCVLRIAIRGQRVAAAPIG